MLAAVDTDLLALNYGRREIAYIIQRPKKEVREKKESKRERKPCLQNFIDRLGPFFSSPQVARLFLSSYLLVFHSHAVQRLLL